MKAFWDGEELDLLVGEIEMPARIPTRVFEREVPFRDGPVLKKGYFESMMIEVVVYIKKDTKEAFDKAVDDLNLKLDVQEPTSLRFDKFKSDRFWKVLPQHGIEADTRTYGGVFRLHFIADGPAYSQEEFTKVFDPEEDGETIEIEVGGSAVAKPTIVVEDPDGVSISNLTDSGTLVWNGSNEHPLIIDCETMTVWSDDVEVSSGLSTVNNKFPILLPGKTNEIEILSSGVATFTYRERYA